MVDLIVVCGYNYLNNISCGFKEISGRAAVREAEGEQMIRKEVCSENKQQT